MKRPHLVLPVLVLVFAAGLTSCRDRGDGQAVARPSATRAVSLRPPPPESAARRVLRTWDERRAAAYAVGSVPDLRALYVAGPAGDADALLLHSYVERGLVVQGMRMQVLGLDVLRASERRLRVRVTDRLVGATAVGAGGEVGLPRDAPTTRVLSFVRSESTWRLAAVS